MSVLAWGVDSIFFFIDTSSLISNMIIYKDIISGKSFFKNVEG